MKKHQNHVNHNHTSFKKTSSAMTIFQTLWKLSCHRLIRGIESCRRLVHKQKTNSLIFQASLTLRRRRHRLIR